MANVQPATLRRTISLPLLVFYGVGVTVGAGIFALVGEILRIAGTAAPSAFLLSGLIAGVTGFSYALLVTVFPKAGGEAVFVNRGLGNIAGWLAGAGVTVTGIISSAAIARAFAGYTSELFTAPAFIPIVAVILLLTLIAMWGVRESVMFAALVTVLEVGTLIVVIAAGLPTSESLPPFSQMVPLDAGLAALSPVLGGAILAFFAFIGFEDIENMAEETIDPARNAPRAIFWTLGITVLLYVALSVVAVSSPARDQVANSPAPVAVLFEAATGLDSSIVAAMAAVAMINGILVQIVMAARVLYGMANEGLAPLWLAKVHATRQTPLRATLTVSALVLVLALSLPLVRLAEMTSLVTLAVFALVNLSLFALGSRNAEPKLRRWRWWGLLGAAVCIAIPMAQLLGAELPAH
ncbi:MAG: amino acid permease [Rhizobiaceae bacterium]